MAASYSRAAHSLASRLCASAAASSRVCAAAAAPTYPCGYCSQQLAHSTTSSTHLPCPGTSHSPSHAPLTSHAHHHHALPTATPPRRINRRTELDFDELRALQLAGDIALIDVRDTQELENYGGIPGALNIPLCKIKAALQLSEDEWSRVYHVEKPNLHDRNLVFYARGPNASSAAVEIAHRLGYKRSRHYTGGWEDYCKKTGQPLKKSQDGGLSGYYMDNFDRYFL